MRRERKIEKPMLEVDGEKIELGEVRLEEDKEMVAKTFESYIPLIQDAFFEFLNKPHEGGGSKVIGDPDEFFAIVKKDFADGKQDIALALAIIEAGLLSVREKKNKLEEVKKESVGEMEETTDRLDLFTALEARYQEAEDFFFTQSEMSEALPLRGDLMSWVLEEKKVIERDVKEEKNEYIQKIFESKLRSEVPAFERFLNGKAVVDDYNTIISALEARLDSFRDTISDALFDFMEHRDSERLEEQVENDLKKIYVLRSLLSMAEGERNEKIALRK